MMMASLFQRDWELIVDTLDISALDFSFHVIKNAKAEPNKLEIRVYNLSPDHISQITKRATAKQSTGVPVKLSAGYVGNVPLIFNGDAREIHTVNEGADRITVIAAHDGGRAFRESRINQSFGPGASVSSVIAACANAMGIGIGNALDASQGASVNALGSSFPSGIVLSGKASDQLTRVTKAAGMSWSIQNMILQLQKGGVALQTSAVRIAPDSGMIESPSVDMDSNIATSKASTKKPTLLNVKTLIIPGLYPGRKVLMDSAEYKGGYQIVEAKYTGETFGTPWYIDSKLRPY